MLIKKVQVVKEIVVFGKLFQTIVVSMGKNHNPVFMLIKKVVKEIVVFGKLFQTIVVSMGKKIIQSA